MYFRELLRLGLHLPLIRRKQEQVQIYNLIFFRHHYSFAFLMAAYKNISSCLSIDLEEALRG